MSVAGDGFQVVQTRRKPSQTSKKPQKSVIKSKSSNNKSYSVPNTTRTPGKPALPTPTPTTIDKKLIQNSLRVTKLHSSITKDDLLTHFKQVSPVDSVKMAKFNSAYINFASHAKGKLLFFYIKETIFKSLKTNDLLFFQRVKHYWSLLINLYVDIVLL